MKSNMKSNMKSKNNFINITLIVLAMIGMVLMTSCTKDDEDTAPVLGNQLKLTAAVASTR